MKKNINFQRKIISKNTLIIIISGIFLFFICTSLALFDRSFLKLESTFKQLSGNINDYFIDKMYSKKDFNKNLNSSKIEALEDENNELKGMLSLKEKNDKYVIANVINHTSKIWFDKLEISKGYLDGIKKDAPVINEKGLIGFISKTSKNISEVKLLTNVNENDMISVLINVDGKEISGILKEYDSKRKMFKITDCLSRDIIKQGSKVVLSGYGNEVYKGIYIGEVKDEVVSDYGLSKTLFVSSLVNFDDILFVAVLGEEK